MATLHDKAEETHSGRMAAQIPKQVSEGCQEAAQEGYTGKLHSMAA